MRRAAVVSVQLRRSSRRSLFSCRANRYLEGSSKHQRSTPQVLEHTPFVSAAGEHTTQEAAAAGDIRADSEQRPSDKWHFRGLRDTVLDAGVLDVNTNTDMCLPGTLPIALHASGELTDPRYCCHTHNHTHSFVRKSRNIHLRYSLECD